MKKEIYIIMMIQLLIYLGFGIIIPVVPEIIVQNGLDSVHLGGILAIYSVASFLTAPFWGSVSDRKGRKYVILIGLAGYSLSFLLFGLFIEELWMLYLSRAIGGMFSGAIYSGATAYVADLSDEENRNKYMGFVGMSIGLGFILGPSIGGILSALGLTVPFFASAGLLFLLLIAASIILPESANRVAGGSKRRIFLNLGHWKGAILYLFAFTFLTTFLLAGLESTFQLFEMEKINVTPFQVGMMFMVSGLFDAGIQGGVVRRIKNGREPRWIIGGQLLSAAALLLIPMSVNLVTAGLYLALFTAGNALVRTCVLSLITKQAAPGEYGLATGTSYSMDSIGRISGPLVFSLLYQYQGAISFTVAGLLAGVSTLLIFRFSQGRRQAV